MKAMILAAGRGVRMRPLTDNLPKPLLKAGQYALVEYHLKNLASAGIKEVVMNVSYLGDKIQQALGTGKAYGLKISYSVEAEPLETAGGIIKALSLLGTEPFLCINGDIWTDYPFAKLNRMREGSLAHLVLVDNPDHHPQGDFELEGAQYTFSGVSLLHPRLFSLFPAKSGRLGDVLRQAFFHKCVSGEYYAGRWMDIGTPERLRQLNEWITR